MTDLGRLSSDACDKSCSQSRSFCTMKSARSPTAFDDGVTLMSSPSRASASRYRFTTSRHRPNKPSASA